MKNLKKLMALLLIFMTQHYTVQAMRRTTSGAFQSSGRFLSRGRSTLTSSGQSNLPIKQSCRYFSNPSSIERTSSALATQHSKRPESKYSRRCWKGVAGIAGATYVGETAGAEEPDNVNEESSDDLRQFQDILEQKLVKKSYVDRFVEIAQTGILDLIKKLAENTAINKKYNGKTPFMMVLDSSSYEPHEKARIIDDMIYEMRMCDWNRQLNYELIGNEELNYAFGLPPISTPLPTESSATYWSDIKLPEESILNIILQESDQKTLSDIITLAENKINEINRSTEHALVQLEEKMKPIFEKYDARVAELQSIKGTKQFDQEWDVLGRAFNRNLAVYEDQKRSMNFKSIYALKPFKQLKEKAQEQLHKKKLSGSGYKETNPSIGTKKSW